MPETSRPDPDALLALVQQEEARARRGSLKIFFGASAGVGKTYAMLAAAGIVHKQGTPVVIGVVETHGRPDTEALARDLPRLPLQSLPYRGHQLREFDLDAALAFGAQHQRALVLLDELAHSNVAGMRHPKRWQDAEELLAAGIDVWSTMNVQHLESLNDIVSGITGIRVWETVPDHFFDDADEVVVVDLPPDELLARLKAGKIYLPRTDDNRAEHATANFFRKGNLLALRELTLRRTADRVDGEMRAYRRSGAVKPVWPNREALLAAVGPDACDEKVIRSTARMAARLGVSWHAVHVEPPGRPMGETAQQTLKLAESLGATTATISAPDTTIALVRYARENNLARLVLGRRTRRWPWQRSVADRIADSAEDLDLVQVGLPPTNDAKRHAKPEAARDTKTWRGYLWAVAACALTALLATPLLDVLDLSNIVMLFLLVVVGVGLVHGRGPAVLAAFLGVVLFDYAFVEPRFTLAVSDAEYLVTFGVMLAVALVVGQLTAGLKQQAEAATQREHRVRSLYDMARDLSAALMTTQVAEISARFLTGEFGAHSTLLAADDHGQLQTIGLGTAPVDTAVTQWAYERGDEAGRGTNTLPASACLVLPLKAPMRVRGVLVIEPPDTRPWSIEQRRLLQTCSSLLAISLERIHYNEVAQSSTVQIESERLRNSLLSAISHDLRTPLASMVGLADALELTPPVLSEPQREVVDAMRKSAYRMNAQVNNLLDMARLQAGAVQLNRAWQPLEEVVGSALAACGTLLAERNIHIDLSDDLPLLHLDAVLMERVLVNLLENASKYTPMGSAIHISARLRSDTVVLMLDDEGPGLPKGHEARVFEKFERGQREGAMPGVGLGLAICRAIVEAHGGSIEGHNRLQADEICQVDGARFVITLPCGTPPSDLGTTTSEEK